jgi:hypothetical protein
MLLLPASILSSSTPLTHCVCTCVCLLLQHHVNPEHAAHHAAVDSKDVMYDGNDGKLDDDVGRLPSKDIGNNGV